MSSLESKTEKTLDIYLLNTVGKDADTVDAQSATKYDDVLIIEDGIMRKGSVTILNGLLPNASGLFPTPMSGRYTLSLNENGIATALTRNAAVRRVISVEAADGKLKLGMFGNASEYDFAPDARVYIYQVTGGGMMGMMGGGSFAVTVLDSGMTAEQYLDQVKSYVDGFDWNDEISIYLDSKGKIVELFVSKVDGEDVTGISATNKLFNLFTGTPLTDEQLIADGIPSEYEKMETIRSIDAGIYDPVKYGADNIKKYPVFVWLHGMGAGTSEQTQFMMSGISKLARPEYQADFHNGAAYIIAARANEDLPNGPSWLEGPGGFGYNPIGVSFTMRQPGEPRGLGSEGGGSGEFGTGIAVYAPALVRLILDFLETHPNADLDRIYISGFSAGGSMTQRLVYYTETGDRGIKFAAAAPLGSPMNLNPDQFLAIKNVPIWMMVGLYDSAAYSEATPAACTAVKGFAKEGQDNARVTVYETIITPQGVTVHQHMVPTGVENNMIFNANVPINYTVFESSGKGNSGMMANGHPGHSVVGTPPVLNGPHMQWYGMIFDESDPRHRFGANPESSFSNEGTFASWVNKWSLKNRPGVD